MGILERIAQSRRPAEQRYSADQWLLNFLQPSQFNFGGVNYPFGLSTTWSGERIQRVSNTLPAYAAALRSCPPAFAAQMVRALVLSQMRFTWRNLPSSRTPRRLFGTSELGVLERPWPKGTTGDLVATMEWHSGLAGNAFAARPRPDRIKVLRPDWCGLLFGSQQDPDEIAATALDGELLGLVYQNGGIGSGAGKLVTLLPDEFAHWSQIPDPECPGMGQSWITAAIADIQGDRAATEHKLKFFTNGATPNMVVNGITAATREKFTEIVDAMEEKHAGIANAYKTLYLAAGADAKVVGSDMKQLDFKATQGAGETRIAMLGRVPAPLLGISEGLAGSSLNAGNFGMARRIFADSWIYPSMQDLAASLESILRVPGRGGVRDAELWFETTDMPILREDAKDAAEITQTNASTIGQLVREGFTPDSAKAAVIGQDMSLLVHSGLVSVQLQAPGSAPPASPAKAAPTRQLSRDFNPRQPRDDDGQWSDGIAGPATDPLKLAGRIRLGPGERFAGSAKVDDDFGDFAAVMAGIGGSGGPRVRFALVHPQDVRRWRAEDRGRTVELDSAGVAEFERVLNRAMAEGKAAVADYRAKLRALRKAGVPESQWPSPEVSLAAGVIQGSRFGDVHWRLTVEEGPEFGDYGPGGEWNLAIDPVARSAGGQPNDDFAARGGSSRKLVKALQNLLASAEGKPS